MAVKAELSLDYVNYKPETGPTLEMNPNPNASNPLYVSDYGRPARWSWGGTFSTSGVQTTPGIARGALINTGVYITNSQVAHVCDFKFNLSTGFSLTALVPNVGILLGAIKNGKNAASAAIRTAITKLNQLFRLAIDAILGALNFDVTGVISTNFSFFKEKVREINENLKIAAQVLADVAMVYFLLQQIDEIINWINSLPERVRKIVEDCVLNFNSSIASVGTQFANGLNGTEDSLTAAFLNENDAPEPTTITTYVTDPANASIDSLSADINAGIESGKASVSDYFGSKFEKQSKP
jgi:hypothetical protein